MIGIDSVTWNGDLGHTLTFGDLLKGGYKKKREMFHASYNNESTAGADVPRWRCQS